MILPVRRINSRICSNDGTLTTKFALLPLYRDRRCLQQIHSPVDDVQHYEQLIRDERDERHVAAASAASAVRAEWPLIGETQQQQQFDVVDSQVIEVVTRCRHALSSRSSVHSRR